MAGGNSESRSRGIDAVIRYQRYLRRSIEFLIVLHERPALIRRYFSSLLLYGKLFGGFCRHWVLTLNVVFMIVTTSHNSRRGNASDQRTRRDDDECIGYVSYNPSSTHSGFLSLWHAARLFVSAYFRRSTVRANPLEVGKQWSSGQQRHASTCQNECRRQESGHCNEQLLKTVCRPLMVATCPTPESSRTPSSSKENTMQSTL